MDVRNLAKVEVAGSRPVFRSLGARLTGTKEPDRVATEPGLRMFNLADFRGRFTGDKIP